MIRRILFVSFMLMIGRVNGQITSNDTLNNFVKTWLKVPYRFGGTSKRGIDCSKLVQRAYKEVFNLEIPRISRDQWKVTKRVPKDSLKSGDLVFFRSGSSPTGWHVGLYLADNYFIHASSSKTGVKISSLTDTYYKKTYKGGGRL
jgi:lipoprotein Spr